MYSSISLNVRILSFRCREVVWGLLVIFFCSLIPSVSVAQQSTATISTLRGTVLVNGEKQGEGFVLKAGDVIETESGADLVLTLSDGSTVQLGEDTKIDLDILFQAPDTGARKSRLKLLYGRIRVFLSLGHQKKDSDFTVETPNAQMGVKFSKPNIEFIYDREKKETIGITHTAALSAKNLITGETQFVPIGSTVIITEDEITVLGWIRKDFLTGAGGGMGRETKIAFGIGIAAAIGAGVAVAASSGGGGNGGDVSFTGTFRKDIVFYNGDFKQQVYTLNQNESTVNGTFDILLDLSNTNGCRESFTLSFTGIVEGNLLSFSMPAREACCCLTCCARIGGGDYTGEIEGNGASFNVSGSLCGSMYDGCGLYSRQ